MAELEKARLARAIERNEPAETIRRLKEQADLALNRSKAARSAMKDRDPAADRRLGS